MSNWEDSMEMLCLSKWSEIWVRSVNFRTKHKSVILKGDFVLINC